jgi:polar amino acid transport system permease protein
LLLAPIQPSHDLLYQADLVSSETFRPLETLTTAAAIYFAIAFPATLASAHVEKRLNRYRARWVRIAAGSRD